MKFEKLYQSIYIIIFVFSTIIIYHIATHNEKLINCNEDIIKIINNTLSNEINTLYNKINNLQLYIDKNINSSNIIYSAEYTESSEYNNISNE
ncbi:hypothetical protein CHREV_021 [Choristoneura rosaceana entomopoxvirus 'L']|uniref:Uncharacterized protein n=1 Tax=Choristoneura rosaceana entomopoxvirus 'L' TaxID=1293539 RepID=A0ABM9QK69_9POXV|nr:hypothetical protein CHREV_021 [Choristoneura rosaceana entomopoxvirus 'L']CCU55923.1 hypothetical protein CHREV_021 [Choristoneura rosaceana entomopoxvirus 'L']